MLLSSHLASFAALALLSLNAVSAARAAGFDSIVFFDLGKTSHTYCSNYATLDSPTLAYPGAFVRLPVDSATFRKQTLCGQQVVVWPTTLDKQRGIQALILDLCDESKVGCVIGGSALVLDAVGGQGITVAWEPVA